MKGIVKYRKGKGNVALRDVEERRPSAEEVKIEVKATGLCGSDLHTYHDEIKIPVRPPVVMGHEFSGVVVEVGEKVTDVSVGDRVTAESGASVCGTCRYCRSGHSNLCPERRVMGYWVDGSFARYCVASADRIHRLPDTVDFIAAALTEPAACCVHGIIEQTGISAGDFVVVVGPGAIGLLSLQLALAEGGTVLICGTSGDGDRLKLAQDLGANYAVDMEEEDLDQMVQGLTDAYGADVVLECAGAPSAARLALHLVRKRGKYAQLGLFGRPIEIDFEWIAFKELQVTGSIGQRRPSWERALKLMASGKLRCAPLVSHEMPFEDWERAFQMFERREGVKLVFRPD